jgi:type I restriction enzyme R subunit
LLQIAPTVKSVDDLISEEDKLKFVQAFRELMRLKNILTSYSDFNWDDLPMNEQSFEDYKSKYLDIYDKVRSDHKVEKASILNDVDFELELIHRDEINVAYILKLIAKLKGAKQHERTRQKILALGKICEDEQLDQEQFKALIDAYVFNGQEPLREDVIKCLAERPSILQARRIGEKILAMMKEYVQTYISGLVA